MADQNPALSASNVLDLRCSAPNCQRRGAYVVIGLCDNCGWEGEVIVSKSHENPRRERCPRCECRRVNGKSFVREEPLRVA